MSAAPGTGRAGHAGADGTALDARIVVNRARAFRLEAELTAAPGETVAVMGPSGAGKSTLLAAIAGHVRLSEGHVAISGRTVSGRRGRAQGRGRGRAAKVPANQRGVVLLGQDPRLFPHLSARDNVAFGLRARGVARALAATEADELLWRVGLPGVGDHRPGGLSGGQQQRVAVARALAAQPDLLLLDEPLTSLDPVTADGIRSVLAELRAGITTVLVTHDAVDAAALASRVMVLEAGRVTQAAPVREVFTRPATAFAASLAGLNRVMGRVARGAWCGGDPIVVLPSTAPVPVPDGHSLAAVFRPSAVRVEPVGETTWTAALRLHREADTVPGEWLARITRLEQTPAGVRLHTSSPEVAVDIAVEDVADLHLAPGTPVRLRLAAEDVRLLPA